MERFFELFTVGIKMQDDGEWVVDVSLNDDLMMVFPDPTEMFGYDVEEFSRICCEVANRVHNKVLELDKLN